MLTGTVLERLEYLPLTGEWYWRAPPKHNAKLRDKLAGTVGEDRCRKIRIGGAIYIASRLAFLWMLGRWPYDEVDHKDRDRTNDRWDNLREATSSLNKYNRDLGYYGSYRGVYRSGNRWWAAAGNRYLGTFDTMLEAISAREEALVTLGVSAFAITDESTLTNKGDP